MSAGRADQVPVKIKVKTDIYDGNEKNTFELTAFGRYYLKENARYLQYDEAMEQGMANTIIKMTEEEGMIMRSGAVKMRLPFKMNKRLTGNYHTPYGVLEMGTVTKRLEHHFNQQKGHGSIDILYDLNMQGANTGTYHLSITFEKEEEH
jgi:uncharacterized beta-barrel protein YwiB (DUF1934 family)